MHLTQEEAESCLARRGLTPDRYARAVAARRRAFPRTAEADRILVNDGAAISGVRLDHRYPDSAEADTPRPGAT